MLRNVVMVITCCLTLQINTSKSFASHAIVTKIYDCSVTEFVVMSIGNLKCYGKRSTKHSYKRVGELRN